MFTIKDGTGGGFFAKVTKEKRLAVDGITKIMAAHAALEEQCFACASGFLSITTTGEWHGIWYLENTGQFKYYVDFMRVSSSAGNLQWKTFKNPSTGTLISGGTSIAPVNTNFKSQRTSELIYKVGGDGFTLTNGTHMGQLQHPTGTDRFDVNGTIILGPGTSIAIMAKASAACEIGSTVYVYKHENEEDL